MEEPVERKDAAVGIATKEPLKTEGLVPSPDTSERSEGASSPPPNCSICLGKLRNTSFTDSCLHQFCFTCLLQWSKIKTECPLCKQTFKSIIHNVRSEEDYDQYHVPRELASQLPTQQITSLDVNFELVGSEAQFRRFVYRTTMTPNRRYGVLLNPEQVARREQIPNMMPPAVSREERRFRRVNPTGYRRNVYLQGEWSNFLPDIHGRLRECSAEYYRRNPHELNRLIPWINRELQILLNANESHIAYVLTVITDSLSRYDIRGPEFRDTVRPYFGPYTDHFAHELLNYARTSFDLVGYDQYVTYPTRGRGLSSDYVGRVVSPVSSVSSTSSDDSDVRVVDQTIDVSRIGVEIPSVGPHLIPVAGPSTVGETFQVPRMTSGPDILTISSSSSSTDECEVVGYVKPRHERTPEIIELVSSDGGVEQPPSNCEASCRSPCESRDVELDRAGPSHEARRRVPRRSSRVPRASVPRWSTSSESGANEESVTAAAGSTGPSRSRRRRKKSSCSSPSRRASTGGGSSTVRPRLFESSRKSRATDEKTTMSPLRSRSAARRRKGSTSSGDRASRQNPRRGARDRAQKLRQLGLTNSDTASGGKASRSNSSSSASSSSNTSSRSTSSSGRRSCLSAGSGPRSAKLRKDHVSMMKSKRLAGANSPLSGSETSSKVASTSSKSSSSSSNSSSDSETAWSGESSINRRRRIGGGSARRSRRRDSVRESLPHHQQPVNATILRKNSSNPNEWYVKKRALREKSSRSRSLSSSSCSSSLLSSSRASPRRAAKKKSSVERKATSSGRAKRDAGEVDSSTSENADDLVTIESSLARPAGISGRTRAKERSRHKDGLKRRRIRSGGSSDSGKSRSQGCGGGGGGGGSVATGRRRDHETRSSDQAKRKDPATKRGSDDHGRKRERSARSGDQNKSKRNDQTRKRGESSRNRDLETRNGDHEQRRSAERERKKSEQGRKRGNHERKANDQDRRKNDHDHRKTDDQETRNADQARKFNDQERKSNDHERKSNDQERKSNDQARKSNDQTRKSNDQERKGNDQERNRGDQERKGNEHATSGEHPRKIGDQTSRNSGARKRDHGRRNDEDDQAAGTSRHSDCERKTSSKEKHKRKKKQKLKRRRSRSESKCESRNSRHRMERSSSYSAPTSNRDDL